MRNLAAIAALTLTAAGCGRQADSRHGAPILLTRAGCANTTVMRERLEQALTGLGRPAAFDVVSLDALPAADQRTAYPTPTVLYRGRDLFGLAEPTPPHAQPG